jgi:hypothetical protein
MNTILPRYLTMVNINHFLVRNRPKTPYPLGGSFVFETRKELLATPR